LGTSCLSFASFGQLDIELDTTQTTFDGRKSMGTDRKVAVITGSSSGIGAAFVKAYRERGWRVVGNARTIATSNDPDYITVPGDIGDPV
jgi:hypothetical protein